MSETVASFGATITLHPVPDPSDTQVGAAAEALVEPPTIQEFVEIVQEAFRERGFNAGVSVQRTDI